MAKTFTKNKPAINITMVGFGQAGSRMADQFAAIKNADGTSVYNCLALNSNDGDLAGLKHITPNNRESLELGGLGKNPEEAMQILETNEKVKEQLKSFIKDRVRPTDDLVMFFAGLGGGTGTSTIVKAIEEFYEYNNKPKIQEEFNKLKEKYGIDEIKKEPKKYLIEATKIARKRFTKIGVVATIPTRADGPDVLRQVNNFTKKIDDIAKNPNKGVAFVVYPDNQLMYEEFNSLLENERKGIENYRDYANIKLVEEFHELNTATTGGGTSVTFDSADFRRTILEHQGCLFISKVTKPASEIKNGHDINKMFSESLDKNSFHDPIELINPETNQMAKIHHIGILAIIDSKLKVGSSFIDDARDEIINKLPLNGTVFSGYIEEQNDFSVTVYTFFKAEAFPKRLAKGLVEEYNEFKERQKQITYMSHGIEQISETNEEDDFDLSELAAELGVEDLFEESVGEVASSTDDEDIDIDDILQQINENELK